MFLLGLSCDRGGAVLAGKGAQATEQPPTMDASEIKPTDAFLRLKVNELKEICLAGGLTRQGRKLSLIHI